MDNFPNKIRDIINNGYEFKLGDYISRGFALMQANLGGFIGYFLVYALITMVLAFIPFVGSLASMVITPVLTIGPYHVAHLMDKGKMPDFNAFFKGFDRLGDLFLTYILQVLVLIGAMLPGIILAITTLGASFIENMDSGDFGDINFGMVGIAFLLIMIPVAYFAVSYSWSLPLVWFYNMKPWPALEASRKLIGKQWFMLFLFLLVCGLIAASGLILLGVGILFTAPAMSLAHYAAFADVTKLNEEDTETDIIDHFGPSI
jgi:hypothetical protein